MGGRQGWYRPVAVAIVVLFVGAAAPLVAHGVEAIAAGRPTRVVAQGPGQRRQPQPAPPRASSSTTPSTLAPATGDEEPKTPEVAVGGLAKPAPPPAIPAARPDDRSSWVAYLGPLRATTVQEQEIAGALFTWANAEREARGLPPLRWSADLAHSARWWSLQMVDQGMGHSRFLGLLPERYVRTRENVGWASPGDAARLHAAWMDSPPHVANMLDAGMDVMGIGVACAAGGQVYVTQHFGARRPDTPAEGQPSVWHPDENSTPGPDGRNGPTRCKGSRPASEDPPEEEEPEEPEGEEPTTTSTTTPPPTSTSSTSTTSSSTTTTTTSSSSTTTTTTTTTTSTTTTTTTTTSTPTTTTVPDGDG